LQWLHEYVPHNDPYGPAEGQCVHGMMLFLFSCAFTQQKFLHVH